MTDIDQIYREYFTDVYRYLLSLCRNESIAEEITQETFFKALKNLNKFEGNCTIYGWLCQIAKNTYYSYCKKQKHLDYDTDLQYTLSGDKEIEEALLQKETAFQIHKILHHLEEPYKEMFTLRTFSELSFSQIAELFGKTESWARVTYHRAKLKIKEETL